MVGEVTSYQIRAVAAMTGLSTDTIRGWERRYGLVHPARDDAGVRQYSESDVARLRLARDATRLGHPIRRVAELSDSELGALTGSPALDARARSTAEVATESILDAVERYDIAEAERVLRSAAVLVAPDALVLEILAPLLRAVGDRWQGGRLAIAQEHLISHLVRSVVGSLSRLNPPTGSDSLLFATPPEEPHEFGILLAASLASLRGIRTYVLGARVPVAELLRSARALRPRAVVLGATMHEPEAALERYIAEALAALPKRTHLWVGGQAVRNVDPHLAGTRVTYLRTLDEFERSLDSLAPDRGAR